MTSLMISLSEIQTIIFTVGVWKKTQLSWYIPPNSLGPPRLYDLLLAFKEVYD